MSADLTVVNDRESLVAALRERGLDYLAPSDARGEAITDAALIASLAANSDSRLRQALIGLFLLRPDLALLVPGLQPALDAAAQIELVAHYLAAVYLQTMWSVRLSHYGAPATALPDFFTEQLALPAPDEGYGKVGLYALADWHAAHSPGRANHLAEYENAADLLFASLKSKARRRVAAPAG